MVTKHKLKGICVEPIKEYFAKLSHTYQNYQHVKPINKAIAEKSGPISMYRVNTEHQDSLPDWSVGIASLDSKHHQKSNIDKHYMVEETVEAITFSTLLQEEEITDVDLVVIDTEGYDLKIIEMIRSSFTMIAPTCNLFAVLNCANLCAVSIYAFTNFSFILFT